MTPVLIYTDNAAIAAQTNVLNNSVPYFQGIYNALQAIGITPTLQEISSLSTWIQNGNGVNGFELSYVTNKLLDIAGNANFNGVSIPRDKLASLISIPDLSAFKAALAVNGQVWQGGNTGVDITMLQLADNVISIVETAVATITAKYTYYTTSDASATLCNNLQAVCDALNNYETSYNNPILNAYRNSSILMAFNNIAGYDMQKETPFLGVAVLGTTFVVSLKCIRKFEANGFVS